MDKVALLEVLEAMPAADAEDRVRTVAQKAIRRRSIALGSFFALLLERRRRVDQALFAGIMEAYLHGVSTRKVDDLVKALGDDPGISKSEILRIRAGF